MLNINPKIFKAYDIRGLYGEDFSNDFAYQLGLAFVALRKNDADFPPDKKLRVAVAADMRLSSPALKKKLLAGLIAGGVEAVDLGEIATPSLYFAVGHYNYDGGIMVSASHNPKEWNGFKIVRSNGLPVSGQNGLEWLRDKILENKLKPAVTPGKVSANSEVLKDELTYAFSLVDKQKIKAFKIVADAANSMGATYLKPLFTDLSAQLIPLNFELDGNFPAHEADPLKEENMRQLSAAVIKEGADLGIATDGDGDRVFFVDNQGKTIDPAIIRGLLSQIFLKDKPGSKIGYDARPGKITKDMIEEAGGQAVITRVGHSLIKGQMLKEGLYFAGESSGHFFLQGEAGCFEYPPLMILKLLEHFSGLEKDLASYLKVYKKYFHSGEINRVVADSGEIFKKLASKYQDGKISYLDGISVEYPDFWFNVRASNTEAKVRLNLEAINEELMKTKRDEVLALIN